MTPVAAAALVPLLAVAAPRPGAPDLVDVARAIPDATIDLRYATRRNVVGRAMYPPGARCLLLRPVAERLARAAARLRAQGFTLRLWDCYRPLAVQRELWRVQPTPGLVADPRTGSNHNRGAAVDAALAGPAGVELELPTDFDAFGPRARASATEGVSPAARRHRELLRAALVAEGFRPIRLEWWHFDAPEARGTPLLDEPLAP
ncbi:MAG TPA: M15 family metallopeptidase [Anaeromyxobacter sp.]|nr:M15 family metallopeptidase [Anaeromyxobacter sp.]